DDSTNEDGKRLRAACALAEFALGDAVRWEKAAPAVARMLANQNGPQWTDALRGVGKWLLPALADLVIDEHGNVSERGWLASVYGRLASELPDGYDGLEKQLAQTESAAPDKEKLVLIKRQARIGVALVAMGRGAEVWRLLEHQPDPTLRSFLVAGFGGGGVDPRLLLSRLGIKQPA